ncbi:VOC family protein [Micromonospora sp. URMC 106]|uniref:VOC family protein n=1 Tax=Micromonospora sp. URMC 106 TaxID=3423408 RepID=UPI003F1DC888
MLIDELDEPGRDRFDEHGEGTRGPCPHQLRGSDVPISSGAATWPTPGSAAPEWDVTSPTTAASYSSPAQTSTVVNDHRLCGGPRQAMSCPSFDGAGAGGSPRVGQNDDMPSRLAAIAIDAVQPRLIADFWCSVLGWQVVGEDAEVITIAASDRSWPMIDVAAVPEGKVIKNRLHFDLRADGVSTAEELDRLLALGARRVDVGQPADVSWIVLADPEGNEFCLLSRPVQEFQDGFR